AEKTSQHEGASLVAGKLLAGTLCPGLLEKPDLPLQSEHLEDVALAQVVADITLEDAFHVLRLMLVKPAVDQFLRLFRVSAQFKIDQPGDLVERRDLIQLQAFGELLVVAVS